MVNFVGQCLRELWRLFIIIFFSICKLSTMTFESFCILKISIINHSILPKGKSFISNSAFPLLSSYSPFIIMLSFDILFCLELSSRLPFLQEHPSAGTSFLTNGPANFFFSSLSVPALFFLLPLFLAQLHFLFCLSILHAPSFSIPTSQMLPVVFSHSVVVSRSLHHTTLHSTQNTSLVSSVVLFPRVRRKCFFIC